MTKDLQALTARFVTTWHHKGPGTAISQSLKVLCKPFLEFGGLRFFRFTPGAALPEPVLARGWEIREASPADAERLLMDRPTDIVAPLIGWRFARGDRCIMVRDAAGRCLHARWLSTRPTWIPEISRHLVPAKGQWYGYDAYTRADARGRGIDSAVRLHIFRLAQAEGVREVITYVQSGNMPGLGAARKWQKEVGALRYIGIRNRWTLLMGAGRLPGDIEFLTAEQASRRTGAGGTPAAIPLRGTPPRSGDAALRLETLRSRKAFTELRGEWNALLQSSPADNLFLTWEWLHTWWTHLAEDYQPQILLLRRGDRLVAAAPLALRPRRPARLLPFPALEFLGMGPVGSDYLDLLIHPAWREEAMEAFTAALAGSGQVLQLSGVSAGSSTLPDLACRLQDRGWKLSLLGIDRCPWIAIEGRTWEGFVASLGSSHRSNLRRRLRKLDKHFVVRFEQVRSEARRREALRILVRLHLQRWAGKGGSNALSSTSVLAFHEDFSRLALSRGWLRLYLLHLNGHPAAAFYCFAYGGRLYYYQTGFDTGYGEHSVGLAGLGMVIRQALEEEGLEEFDFLRGSEAYKYLWADTERQLLRYDCFPPDVRGTLYHHGMHLREQLKRLPGVAARGE